MSERKIDARGLEESDRGALNNDQRNELRKLKVDIKKTDEQYLRVSFEESKDNKGH